MNNFEITPSLYTSDTLNLQLEVEKLMAVGIKQVHFDVMDGHYVANYGFGTKQLVDLKTKFPNLIVDVHTMANDLSPLLNEFKLADYLTFHFRSHQLESVDELINKIKLNGNKVGLGIDLDVSFDEIVDYLPQIDLLTVMSITPGFTGQSFDPTTWTKLQTIKTYLKEHNLPVKVQIDGGVRWTNLKQLIDYGTDLIVVGSLMFSETDYQAVMDKINQL